MARDSRDRSEADEKALQDGTPFGARFTRPVMLAGAAAIRNFDPALPDAPHGPGPAPGPAPGEDDPRFDPRPVEPVPGTIWEPSDDDRELTVVDVPGGGESPEPKPAPPRDCAQTNTMASVALGQFTSINHFWQNWPKTHAYVASLMCFPRTVDEIGAAIRRAEGASLPLRAFGGGWSFSDAVIPGNVTTPRPDVAAADQIAQRHPPAQGFRRTGPSVAIIDRTDASLIGYDARNRPLTGGAVPWALIFNQALGGAQPANVCLINTRSMKSSLQEELDEILAPAAKKATAPGLSQRHYFHVEGGITIQELNALLDAQSPRLVLEASGGNPGATIAGSLSTGTHGAEWNMPLLVDRVKAVHMVGPGGLQWWIEGDDPVADPDALLARYPCLSRSRIISGTGRVLGATPQDWLNAVVVSMGCIGVIYSVVLEVEPISGQRGVVSQTTWWSLLSVANNIPIPTLNGKPTPIAGGSTGESLLKVPGGGAGLSAAIVKILTDGSFSNQIPSGSNVYADLAFNPNRRADGDLDCWIVNRNRVAVPFDPQPPNPDGMTDVVEAVFGAMSEAYGGNVNALVNRIGRVYGFIDPVLGIVNTLLNPGGAILGAAIQAALRGPAGAILGQALTGGNPTPIINAVNRIQNAADKLDVALDELCRPLANASATDLAQPLLTGILAAILGTAKTNPGISIGTSVGNVGFPDQGLVGAGLEVAMPEAVAFPFIQREILDRMIPTMPFFGYVSIRICPKSNALLGMAQWDRSVMIEIVSFGDSWGRTFVTILQTRIVSMILSGELDAMLHWGLECEQLSGRHLMAIPAMARPTQDAAEDPASPGVALDRFAAFKQIRDNIRAAGGTNPSSLFRAFDNAFTARLGL